MARGEPSWPKDLITPQEHPQCATSSYGVPGDSGRQLLFPVLVCYGCHIKVSKIGWFTATEIDCPTFLEVKSPRPRCWQSWFLLRECQSVQSLSRVQLFSTPWTAARQASLSITNSQSLIKLMSVELVMPSNHFILCCPLLLLPSIFPSTRVFSNESVLCIRWPKYWSFNFSISPSSEYSGLISFRTDWFDVLAVQAGGSIPGLSPCFWWFARKL